MNAISLRDYAAREGISLGTAYRRLWEGRVNATKRDGRWLISTSTNRTEQKGREIKIDHPPSKREPTDASITTPVSPILNKQILCEMGGPVKLPKHPLLETLEHARMLSRELGWLVVKSNTNLLAEAILAESKSQRITQAKAYELLRERVLADREIGVSINRAYFEEAKWRLGEASEPRPGDSNRARKKLAATEPGNVVPGASGEQER